MTSHEPRPPSQRRHREPSAGWQRSLPTITEIWDVLLFSMLLPFLLVMGPQLPAQWAHHNGESLPGIATVTEASSARDGLGPLVDVRSAAGDVVAREAEVEGDAVGQEGATFPVSYVPTKGGGVAQVYVAGYDPFPSNVAIFIPILLAWLISLPFVAARARRQVRRVRGRRGRRVRTRYVAGRGYIAD